SYVGISSMVSFSSSRNGPRRSGRPSGSRGATVGRRGGSAGGAAPAVLPDRSASSCHSRPSSQVVMFLLDDAGRRSGWASVLASSPRPFLDLQFSIEVVLSVLFHAPRSSHAGSATVEGEQVRLILTASYCSPARPSHGERRLSLLRHAAYPLQRRFLVPLASSGHHRLSLCLLVCGTRCVPRLAPLDVALFYLPFFLDHSCAASGGAVVRFGFGSWPSNPVVQCC
uniref:Uncharacterized protein n=1 Tax=Aegilops tauschii subsp. strangulata TaxID=200361 RepID=A0A453NPD3_AEGTS